MIEIMSMQRCGAGRAAQIASSAARSSDLAGHRCKIGGNRACYGGKPGEAKARILVNYIVEKDKPLVKPA
jgi:hypothetical protein